MKESRILFIMNKDFRVVANDGTFKIGVFLFNKDYATWKYFQEKKDSWENKSVGLTQYTI